MPTFLSHIEEVLWVDGQVSISIQGPKGISLLLAIAKSFQSWRRVISLPVHLLAAVSKALVREEDRVQKPVYYTSKVLWDTEDRYTSMEKLAFTLVTAACKLKPYFQAYTVIVLTDKPLQRAMSNPKATRWMALWAIKLSKFNIQYCPCTAMKGQVVANFIAKFTNMEGQRVGEHPQ